MTHSSGFLGGIDAGGTTFKCGIGDRNGTILARQRIPVTTPNETLSAAAEFFTRHGSTLPIGSLGIASFGPIVVDPASPDYGKVLETPKPGWSHVSIRDGFRNLLAISPKIDTDVNGALLAECWLGAARNFMNAVYITVGTGIGAGIMVDGQIAGRPAHPEFGHIPIARHAEDMNFEGVCPFHGGCLEGLASATALRARFGDPTTLEEHHPAWTLVADYLGQACRSLYLTLRPERIIIGGGLLLAPHLISRIQDAFVERMGGYLGANRSLAERVISIPQLGDDAGLIGALLLGREGF